jgi:hypothetical protein
MTFRDFYGIHSLLTCPAGAVDFIDLQNLIAKFHSSQTCRRIFHDERNKDTLYKMLACQNQMKKMQQQDIWLANFLFSQSSSYLPEQEKIKSSR